MRYFADHTLSHQLLDAVPSIVLVLNQDEQVVFANLSTLAFLGLENENPILGQRYGEALGCIYAFEAPGGCGTAEF
jgi:hypothetical protein